MPRSESHPQKRGTEAAVHQHSHVAPGTYALVMRLASPRRLQIGKFGTFKFDAGWYVYVGSALGPGGIKRRTDRHLRINQKAKEKPFHWHIDYFREAAVVEEVLFKRGSDSLEHKWSQGIANLPNVEVPVQKFGSQDCRSCPAHLFRFTEQPHIGVLCELLGAERIPATTSPAPNRKIPKVRKNNSMASRALTNEDVRRSLGPLAQTGRRPKVPRDTPARLDQLVKESAGWLRLFREAWFYPLTGMIEMAVGASDHADLPERYDEAIEQMRWIAASARYAEARLREGKKRAIAKSKRSLPETGGTGGRTKQATE